MQSSSSLSLSSVTLRPLLRRSASWLGVNHLPHLPASCVPLWRDALLRAHQGALLPGCDSALHPASSRSWGSERLADWPLLVATGVTPPIQLLMVLWPVTSDLMCSAVFRLQPEEPWVVWQQQFPTVQLWRGARGARLQVLHCTHWQKEDFFFFFSQKRVSTKLSEDSYL